MSTSTEKNAELEKAARSGEPSYVWRAGQERRLQMILAAADDRLQGYVLENGCGIGMYVEHLSPHAGRVPGLEFDFDRAREAQQAAAHLGNAGIICAAGENLLQFESHGVKVLIDATSLPYLDGTELDYTREGLNEGFKFNNPNVKNACGCGESFNVKL